MLGEADGNLNAIDAFLNNFVPRFAPGGVLCGEIGDAEIPPSLGELSGKTHDMPDALLYDVAQDRMLVVDFAMRRGCIDELRMQTLSALFKAVNPNKVYVTVFQSRSSMAEHVQFPAWGSHAWFAGEPEHMIHFGDPAR